MPVSSRSEEERHHLAAYNLPWLWGIALPTRVDWVDALTAECNFCGNLIRGERGVK